MTSLLNAVEVAAAPVRTLTPAERDIGIDALRGLAVVLMIGANLAPYQLAQPYPFWFRVWSSLAAPLFVCLSGLMTGKAAAMRRQRPYSHHAKRGIVLFALAAFVDVCFWRITPFYHFDVLYLLGFLQLVAPRFACLPSWARLGLIVAVFGATEPLQQAIGYRSKCSHVGFDILQAAFIDGWFPMFPWLGLGLVGTHLGALAVDLRQAKTQRRMLALGCVLMSAGGVYFDWTHPQLQARGGYAELFYPPTMGFILCATGFWACSIVGMKALEKLPIATLLAGLGRVALLLYMAHIAVIARIIHPFLAPGTVLQYGAIYFGLTALLWALGRTTKRLWPKPRWFLSKMLLG